MKESILSREEVLRFASDAFGIDYDRLDARFEKYAAIIESALLEKLYGEPYLYVYEYDNTGYVHRQLHAGIWNGARESRCVALYTLKDHQS